MKTYSSKRLDMPPLVWSSDYMKRPLSEYERTPEEEVTQAMIDAGIRALDVGECHDKGSLVKEVYRQMRAALIAGKKPNPWVYDITSFDGT